MRRFGVPEKRAEAPGHGAQPAPLLHPWRSDGPGAEHTARHRQRTGAGTQEVRKGFFFEKRSKKLLLTWAVVVSRPPAQFQKSFCAAFGRKSGFLPRLNDFDSHPPMG